MVKYDICIGRNCKRSTVKVHVLERTGGNRQNNFDKGAHDELKDFKFKSAHQSVIKK
jgi:hypothetical protein